MKHIDGRLLKEILISGANNLYNHYPEIDALNVFPVPDGDTGMNMNLTLASGAKEIQNRNDGDVYSIALSFSKGLLMGARGNSGVITSQIFRGFATSLEGKTKISVNDLALAFENGSNVAYKAVMRPVEGTILTVIRESAAGLKEASNKINSIENAFEVLLKEANKSLKHTPELLPILKEVGVVDSGGAGLVKIFEGMNSAILGEFVEKNEATSVVASTNQSKVASEEFGYCTEFIMRLGPTGEKKQFVENRFKSILNSHGNSIVVVRDEDILKVHIHTLKPGDILSYAQNFGEFLTIKVENMSEQHSKLQSQYDPKQEEKVELKQFGIVAISAGKGIDDLFLSLGVDKIVSGGQTMNPSIEDIVSAIRECKAKTVFVFPNNSNIIMAALQAADVLLDEIKVNVISTKTIPQGLTGVSVFNVDASEEENVEAINDAIANVKSGAVTYAIKDSKIDNIKVIKDQFMAIANKNIVACEKTKNKALLALLNDMINEDSYLLTILIGDDVSKTEEDEIVKLISEKYENVEVDIKHGDQPVYSYLVGIE